MSTSISPKPPLALFLSSVVIVGTTSIVTQPSQPAQTPALVRTALASGSWDFAFPTASANQTAVSDAAPFVLGAHLRSDDIVGEIVALQNLEAGWDGEYAAKPIPEAIREAARFVRAAGDLSASLEPALHVDGSVLLEVGDGAEGSLRFMGDGRVIFALEHGHGISDFKGLFIPEEVRQALEG